MMQIQDLSAAQASSASRMRILESARALFLKEGFSAVSTDRLSRDAGVSKSSIYKHFGDMAGVLAAVVHQEGDLYQLHFDDFSTSAPAFWEGLMGYGTRLLTLLNDDFCIRFDRMLHEEARRHPELGDRFYKAAYGRGHVEIAQFLRHGQQCGFVTKAQSADDLADHLLSMWNGLAFVRARLGLTQNPFASPERWARQCVETLFAEDWRLADQKPAGCPSQSRESVSVSGVSKAGRGCVRTGKPKLKP